MKRSWNYRLTMQDETQPRYLEMKKLWKERDETETYSELEDRVAMKKIQQQLKS